MYGTLSRNVSDSLFEYNVTMDDRNFELFVGLRNTALLYLGSAIVAVACIACYKIATGAF